jgi:hypothetical protein
LISRAWVLAMIVMRLRPLLGKHDTVPAVSASTETPSDEHISVLGLSHNYFKTNLVNHFDILFRQRKIVWPSRTGLPAPSTMTKTQVNYYHKYLLVAMGSHPYYHMCALH